MKCILNLLIIILLFFVFGCEKEKYKVHQDAVELSVDFAWKDKEGCGNANPEIDVSRIPGKTKFLYIEMRDLGHSRDHYTVLVPYEGDGTITKQEYKEIITPCPGMLGSNYEITIKAIDENNIAIGIGSKKRNFPE